MIEQKQQVFQEEKKQAIKKEKSKVFSWGLGRFGAPGHGNQVIILQKGSQSQTQKTVLIPTELKIGSKSSQVIDVSAGGFCSCFVTKQRTVYACGSNKHFRLGLEKQQNYLIPSKVPHLANIIKVSCGLWHTLALSSQDQVFASGYNKKGELGLGHNENVNKFSLNTELKSKVQQISAGKSVSAFLIRDQSSHATTQLLTCGGVPMCGHAKDKNTPKLVPSLPPITIIQCGTLHCACVDIDGNVYTWGRNEFLQLGHKDKKDQKQVLKPTKVQKLNGIKIVHVSCTKGQKYSHTLALDVQGSVYSWGSGYKGKLGHQAKWSHQDAADEVEPRKIDAIADLKIVKVEAGGIHSAIISDKGDLYTFGCGSDGRLGHPQCQGHRYLYKQGYPRKIQAFKSGSKVKKVSFSYYHGVCIVQ